MADAKGSAPAAAAAGAAAAAAAAVAPATATAVEWSGGGAALHASNRIHAKELDWMELQRPLKLDRKQLERDHGADTVTQMYKIFAAGGAAMETLMPALMWPGCGTRWLAFAKYLVHDYAAQHKTLPATPRAALEAFGNHLGRVVSYRSLALDDKGLSAVQALNTIVPTGRLRAGQGPEQMRALVNAHGVWNVAHARLYIGQRLIGPIDPSLSLHDDCETCVCIAEGYADLSVGRKIRSWGVSVPKLEALGYAVMDVQSGKHRWFRHRGIWFDAADETCERYMLYEIPFLAERQVSFKVWERRGGEGVFGAFCQTHDRQTRRVAAGPQRPEDVRPQRR